MIDETAGGASVLATEHKFSVATVDLRVDYMRPAAPRQNLYCTAHIYRLTERIAFFNAQAFNDDPAKPIAVGTGTFLLGANASVPDFLGSPFKVQEMGDVDLIKNVLVAMPMRPSSVTAQLDDAGRLFCSIRFMKIISAMRNYPLCTAAASLAFWRSPRFCNWHANRQRCSKSTALRRVVRPYPCRSM